MTIRYKAVKVTQPGIKGGGEVKYYPRICNTRKIDIDNLAERISAKSSLSRADIRATLFALADEIPGLLLDNYSVHLGELGVFSATISGAPSLTEQEVNHRNIKSTNVVFRPGKKIKAGVKFASFKKA